MKQKELNEILRKHELWLGGKPGGERADLSGMDLHGIDLRGRDLRHIILYGSNLTGIYLFNCDISNSDLGSSTLINCDIINCNFINCNFSYSDFSGGTLKNCNFSGSTLINCNFSNCDIINCNISNCDIRYCNISKTDIRGSDLRGADLDFSSWPLWCSSLDVKADEPIIIQLLYHTLRAAKNSELSDNLRSVLFSKEIVEIANRFHRVGACGMIEAIDTQKTNLCL